MQCEQIRDPDLAWLPIPGHGRSHCRDEFGVVGHNNLIRIGYAKYFHKGLPQRRIEGQRPAAHEYLAPDITATGQGAYDLKGNSVKHRSGDIFLRRMPA